MYSRSYGLIEQSEKERTGFSVPPDYNGNLYRRAEKKDSDLSKPSTRVSAEESTPREPPAEEKKPPASSGITGGFLERLTAEDILLFVFLYSLIRGEGEETGEILGLILALLLL